MLSLAARRVNDRAVIELAVDEVSSAGDERQVSEAVGCWLWSSTGYRPGTVDLFKHPWVEDITDGVDLDLVNNKTNVNV